MIMGEASGIASVRAIDENAAVQDISMSGLTDDLKRSGMILAWDGTSYTNRALW